MFNFGNREFYLFKQNDKIWDFQIPWFIQPQSLKLQIKSIVYKMFK